MPAKVNYTYTIEPSSSDTPTDNGGSWFNFNNQTIIITEIVVLSLLVIGLGGKNII